jgi:23S rRNA (uracil1939-C5)-methyltransferase
VEHELDIEKLVAGGDGMAHDPSGRVIFVPQTAPGDRIRARVTRDHRSYARAELTELERPGPDRVEPGCPAFAARTCGGCQWLHVSTAAQAEAKQAVVKNALRNAIQNGLTLSALERPAPDFGWRRRARFAWFRPRGQRAAVIGFFVPNRNRITDIEACLQLSPGLQRALTQMRAVLAHHLGGQGELLALEGQDELVHVVIKGSAHPDAPAALAAAAGICGVSMGKRRRGRPAEIEPGVFATADQFEQASSAGNQRLRDVVAELMQPRQGARVLELYAGNGNLTRAFANEARETVAVDRKTGAPDLPNVTWRSGDADVVTNELVAHSERFDWVVLDPPRTGAYEVIPALLLLAPEHILYVSCDPATLARDVDLLHAGGYRAEHAVPLDLMPQTAHIEVVVRLRRARESLQ